MLTIIIVVKTVRRWLAWRSSVVEGELSISDLAVSDLTVAEMAAEIDTEMAPRKVA